MRDIAPVRTMTVRQLATLLGSGPLREWTFYKGTPLDRLRVDSMAATDAEFLAFWTQRCSEEVLAFQRVLGEGDFLEVRVAEFFDIPAETRQFLQERESWTMREWAAARLEQAHREEQLLFS